MCDMSYRFPAFGLAFALAAGASFAPAPLSAAEPAGPVPTVEHDFIVVLDPGHGGTNEGCRAWDGHLHEKEVTLALAQELADELHTRLPHAEVRLTRAEDRTLTLAERVQIANAAEADLFVSIHANASPDSTQSGFETYVLDAEASSLEAARTARRENDLDLAKPAQEATDVPPEAVRMLRQLEMTAHRSRAAALAHGIQRAQAERFPERLDRGVKQAPFDVLMGARMPAVLFEAGFLDHDEEGALLAEEDAREPIVLGLADAIVQHYRVTSRLQ